MRYEDYIFVAAEPVPEIEVTPEQRERLVRTLYPILSEYYRNKHQGQEEKAEGAK